MGGTLYLEHSEAHQPRTWRRGAATEGRRGPGTGPAPFVLTCRCGRTTEVGRERIVRGRVAGLQCVIADGGCGFRGDAVLEGMDGHGA